MKINRVLKNFDFILLLSILTLSVIGVLFIFSANFTKSDSLQWKWVIQLGFILFSIFVLFGVTFLNSRFIQGVSIWFYLACLVGIIFTLIGPFDSVKGQKRFDIAGISIQFSEFMKIAVILLLSFYYSQRTREEIKSIFTYLIGAAISIVPVLFILLQPDLGTSLVFIPILLLISYMAGVEKKFILYSFLLIVFTSVIPIVSTINHLYFNNENETLKLFDNLKYILLFLGIFVFTILITLPVHFNLIKGLSPQFVLIFRVYLFVISALVIGITVSYPLNKVLKEYQKDRLLIFFNPYIDEKGKGYHIIQSMTTIGNGGFLGKGWTKGEQVQKYFLPEQATDFIYPVIAEESGFVGSLLVLLLYSIMFYRCTKISLTSRDTWGALVTSGVMVMLLFHILENIGMTIGIMPITGIPLPFLSYGGSFLIACFMGIGLVMNINMNRFQF